MPTTSSWNQIRSRFLFQILILFIAVPILRAQTNLKSGDAYVRREGNEWIMGTSSAERRVRLEGGRFSLVSLRNKISGREYQDSVSPPAEFQFLVDGQDVAASNWRWELRAEHAIRGKQGELQVDIELESAGIRVARHYVIYPETSVIREWLTLSNSSAKPIRISKVDFLHTRLLGSFAQDLQFNYVTGGGNYNGSQLLKAESMTPAYHRILDSNGGIQAGSYSSFLPLVFLHNRTSNEGVAIGWDYLGHWRFEIGNQAGLPLGMSLELAGFEKTLASGE